MDSHQTQPLTTGEAKEQLRHAADRMSVSHWVQRRPIGAMVTGVLAGYLLGKVPHFWAHLSESGVGQRVLDRFV